MNQKTKIIIAVVIIIVAVVGIIGIVVFTSENKEEQQAKVMTKEEMLEVAEDLTIIDNDKIDKTSHYFVELSNNIANAELQKGKIFKINGKVDTIEKDYCIMSFGIPNLKLYLPMGQLSLIKKDSNITVVGQLTDITKEQQMIMGMTYDNIFFEFKNCYFISND